MNGVPHSATSLSMRRMGLILIIAGILLLIPVVVESQGEIVQFTITNVSVESFPRVQLQVAARDMSGSSIDILTDASLRIEEDGVELPVLSADQVDAGIRLAFIIDPGDGVLHTGVRLETVYNTARDQIQTFILGRPWMLAGVDEVMVLIQEGDSTLILAPMGNNPEEIGEILANYIPPDDYNFARAPEYGDYTRAALEHGLDELLYSGGGEYRPQSIILFTPGVRAELVDIAERAINSGISIHVVMTRPRQANYWDDVLRSLADVTGGEFIGLYKTGGMESLFEIITEQRGEYVVTYRSTSSSTGMRQVTLELVRGEQVHSAVGQYSVELEVPQVRIISPEAGVVITRQGSEKHGTAAEANPTFIIVEAEVSWGDKYPRKAGQAWLMVNSVRVDQSQVVNERVEFTWDIREYQTEGQMPAEIEAQVEDELGLLGISQPVIVGIEYIPPSSTSFRPSESLLNYISLGVALVAVAIAVFLFFNRTRIAPVIQQAGENIVDFVERVTGRRTALVARAYLVPLEGFDKLPSKPYEIYGTTAIGRSRRHADLLFHITDEDSPISRLHCTILDEDDHFTIRDEDSTNGTIVNDDKLPPLEPLMLQDGDIVDVAPLERGGLRFMFQLAKPDGIPPTVEDDIRRTKPRRSIN